MEIISKPGAPLVVLAEKPAAKVPPITVVHLIPVRAEKLLASADICFGRGLNEFTVCSWSLVQEPGKAPWVSPPNKPWTDAATGRRRYKTLFTFPPHWREAITMAVVQAWQEYEQAEGGAL